MFGRRHELESGMKKYTTPSGLIADPSGARAVDSPTEKDPRTTFAVPLYSGETLVDFVQHRMEDRGALMRSMDNLYAKGPISDNPQTPETKGKKGAHSRKSKYAKGSKN